MLSLVTLLLIACADPEPAEPGMLELITEEPSALLGENVRLHFTLRNTTGVPLTFGSIKTEGGYGSSGVDWPAAGPGLKLAWAALLAEHPARFASREPFTLGEPQLHSGLVPPGFHFSRADGGRWPEQP